MRPAASRRIKRLSPRGEISLRFAARFFAAGFFADFFVARFAMNAPLSCCSANPT
jgi:hypothetical protein